MPASGTISNYHLLVSGLLMKPSAVMLIDLENFYCSREDYCRSGYDRARFGHDLDKLLGFAREMVDGLPFTVRRAYADFNTVRYAAGAPPQHYLRNIPDELLRQGVEPVQVFRLSRGSGGRGSKNAADMRMAMDATALLAGTGNVEHFVLVTGDADFIPVILELKRNGHTVSVIGVTGATNELIQRFVDNFELFEDLVAAEEVETRTRELAHVGDGLARVKEAVHTLLTRSHPLRFAAVKPLLSKELGHPFDPGDFGCDTTGEFLRKFQKELEVEIRPMANDQEIDLPGAVPSANGSSGVKGVVRPAERKAEKPPPAPPEPHSAAHYQHLLSGRGTTGAVKIPAVPWSALVWSCDTLTDLLAPPDGAPARSIELLPKLVKAAEAASIPELVKHVRMLYPTLRAGLPTPGEDGIYSLPAETLAEHVRRDVLRYIAEVLTERLETNAVAGAIRADSLAAALHPGPATAQAVADVTLALAPVDPILEPPAPPTPLTADGFHSPAMYAKLLRAGGAKGSDTETFKIQIAPWPSVERVCDDAFALLSPTAHGKPMPSAQLVARLIDAGKALGVDKYDQHVRRALVLLRLANILYEDNGAVVMHPDLTDAWEVSAFALKFVLELLQMRLEERDVRDPIRAHAFVIAVEAGPHSERLMTTVAPAIAAMYDEAPAEIFELPPELPDDEEIAAVDAPVAVALPEEVAATSMERSQTQFDDEDSETEDKPVVPAPAEAASPEPAGGQEPFSLDDAPLTEVIAAVPVIDSPLAELSVDSEVELAGPIVPDPAAGPLSGLLGYVDVATITREAMAAAVIDLAPPSARHKIAVPREPEPLPRADDDALAVDWLSDDDPLRPFAAPASAIYKIKSRTEPAPHPPAPPEHA